MGKMYRLFAIMGMILSCATGAARPNWGMVTDGFRCYDIDGDGMRFTLESWGSEPTYCVFLTQKGSDYTVDSLGADSKFQMPKGVSPGDIVMRNVAGFFFFNRQGVPYLSMKQCRSQDDPERARRIDSLMLIQGTYQWGGKKLTFAGTNDGAPRLFIGEGESETISFEADVVHGQRTLMHIKTARRRWLLMPTTTGLSIYQAVWNKQQKKYVRGNLVGNAKLLHPGTQSGLRFDYEWLGLPYLDMLVKFYTGEMVQQLAKETEKIPDNSPAEIFKSVVQRMAEGMKR